VWRQIWSNNPLSVNRPSGDTAVLAAEVHRFARGGVDAAG
jgi:hypothetical protein